MKASEQWFPMVLLQMPYEVVVSFECECEILKCVQSNENVQESTSY